MLIGIVSDTHGHWDERAESFFADCEEVWHAGDLGSYECAERIAAFRPLIAVHGNIDGYPTRQVFPARRVESRAGLRVAMCHIGGYPGRYDARALEWLERERPDLFICGHSHILRVMRDPKLGFLLINPGAYGRSGFHLVRTAIRVELTEAGPRGLEVLEVGRATQVIGDN